MTKKPVRHESLGWDRVCAAALVAGALYAIFAATNYGGVAKIALISLAALAFLGAIHIATGMTRVGIALVRGFGRQLVAIVAPMLTLAPLRALGRFLAEIAELALPPAPVRAIDQLYAEIGHEMDRGRTFKFVYNEQSFRRP